ncbi:porin [Paraburkholderia sp. SIMBA_055]|jgi:predicted porin|uniref:Porin Gram-negative type n=1 Tax=Paraburkholderia graminis (strain ATCC 700544 / DSM 17151 / LMG 18924 / NCIMB 13744 / C4D1M) TaxID=396598 RepID=B1G3D4_PARG4|nr:porin [Paraburkholderia graminis]AXF11151.1 porin [Paraburkholderia graminis]EDT09488.1 porin Gram-negative type [Paraburkholderia graminis C4D1M]MDR6471808.1 putative porin [Paraburkholderia graminis]CAB3707698.1 Outer membrane porin protein 32 [Paraburkholderia graminis C4D1M]
MKKLAYSLLAVASACAFNGAYAQSSVTLYGVVDNGIEYQNGGAGGAVRAVSSGLFATVYGLMGHEDIGGGVHVNFQLEQGFSGVTGAATDPTASFNRLAWIGVSGRFGELRFGRQKKPEYLFLNGEVDPTAVKSFASPINNFTDASVRASNAIAYFLPDFRGLTVQGMVSLRDQTTSPSNGLRFYNVVARYVHGPIHVGAGYESSANATGTSVQKIFRAAASYRLGAARFYLAYQTERQSDHSEKRDIYEASGTYLFNPFNRFSVMYGYAHDRTGQGNNAQQVGLIYEYYLSKSTILYTAAGLIQNRHQAQYTLDGTQYSGIAVEPGAYARGAIVGMTHKF